MKKPIPAPKNTASSRANKTTRRDVVEDRHLKASQAIAGMEECIRGSQVDLGTATDFSKKSWNIYRRLVTDHVRQVSTDLYDLSDRLLRATRNCLEERSEFYLRSGWKAGDVVADALFRAAHEVGPPHKEPDDSSEYWLDGEPIWGANHPISEAWAGLGPQKVPWDMEGSLRFNSGTGKWDVGPARSGLEALPEVDASINTGGFFRYPAQSAPDCTDPLVVRIVRTFETQKSCLPKLTIEVEGAPICLLMKAFNPQVRATTALKDAENLWESISQWVARSSGIKKAKRGRPATYQGREAAILRDFCELPWSKVARKLCKQPPPHHHDLNCQGNFRKQAEQYWKALEKKYCLVE